MLNKLTNIMKRIIIIVMCTIMIGYSTIALIPVAYSANGSSGILGTNSALGSPILNNNFTVDNWNRWEMLCWGVFLSNFCQPFIDTYQSAFTVGNGGSNGDGYKALCFGSGNDVVNNETIESFCTYAINEQEKQEIKQLSVIWTDINTGVLGETKTPADGETLSDIASFKDLFFVEKEDTSNGKEGNTFLDTDTWATWTVWKPDITDAYCSVKAASKGKVPTFYVHDGSHYEVVLDYTNSWDIQMMAALLNSAHNSSYADEMANNLDNYFDSDVAIGMDTFGNIVTLDGVMILPASANQHITDQRSINLINSIVMNSYVTTISDESMVLGLEQSTNTSLFGKNRVDEMGGMPAFGITDGTALNGIGLLYYDTDNIFVQHQGYKWGETVRDLFNCSIDNNQDIEYNLKYEIAGGLNKFYGGTGFKNADKIDNTMIAAIFISNATKQASNPDVLNYIIKTDGEKVSLVGDKPVIIANMLQHSNKSSEPTAQGAIRKCYNYMYDVWTGDTSETRQGALNRSIITKVFDNSETVGDFRTQIKDNVWTKFQLVYTSYIDENASNGWSNFWDWANDESIAPETARLVLAYPVNDVMRSVSSILAVRDGTEFQTYSTMIYMTYLDFYGIADVTKITSGTEKTSAFNPRIFKSDMDILNTDPSSIVNFKSDKAMKEEVLQMSYLMLSPEAGRSYRKELLYNGIADFMYEQYNRVTFGGSDDVYSGSASKSNSGFLAIETYSENWLTSWFLDSYVNIAVWIMGVSIVITIVLGLLKGRKISWYAMCIFTVINVVLIVPSSGEIVPYVTSNFVQNMFSKHMTYWSMAEGITNAELETSAYSNNQSFEGLTDEEASLALELVRQLNVVYLDRSLMLKQDLSQKLTQKLGGVYTEIQQLASARWVLPMVMQQFSADTPETSGDYVYVKLSNVMEDASLLYWYYNPDDAMHTTTATAASDAFSKASSGAAAVAQDREDYSNIKSYFADETDASNWADDSTEINYQNYSYVIRNTDNHNVHLYSYILPDSSRQVPSAKSVLGSDFGQLKEVDDWSKYIDNCVLTLGQSSWLTTNTGNASDNFATAGFDEIGNSYERNDFNTLKAGYSFYRMTESPIIYFFDTVKDQFESDITYGAVIGRLQGTLENATDINGVDIKTRNNFMYATKTSGKETTDGMGRTSNVDAEYTEYVRDVLDLQQFFTNVVPYMYEMTLATGGFDGESGILEDEKISEKSDFYKGMNQSWAYRCNWAVKLMENPEYNKPMTVRKADGTTAKVQNPMIPASYPSDRPMIFSQAQMEALGLKTSDLNLIELKCMEVNNRAADKWTMLINYAGTDGITKEVLFRQMALEGTQEFCREFSSGGLLDNMYGLYPQSIDLRYLSFDSVMKLLMLNVSRDTSYIYGDTMSTMLENSDMFTAALLLLDAFLCAYLVPLARTILMAIIFYLGFISILRALFSSAKYKGKIACGQFISNALFMIYTLAYYACFCGLMALSSDDEILNESALSTNAGNPVWVLLAIMIFSGVYIFIMWKQICFCFTHFRDMGFEMYSTIASGIATKLSETVSSLPGKVSGFFSGESTTNSTYEHMTGDTNSVKGTGLKGSQAQDVNIKQTSGGIVVASESYEDGRETPDDLFVNAYSTDGENVYEDNTSSDDINAQIAAGEQLSSDS